MRKVWEKGCEEEMENTTDSVDKSLELRMCYSKLEQLSMAYMYMYIKTSEKKMQQHKQE